MYISINIIGDKFQSTFLREERLNDIYNTAAGSDFNPRSYERNDIAEVTQHIIGNNFNPRSYERNDFSNI